MRQLTLDVRGKPRSQMPTAGMVLDYYVAAMDQMVGVDRLMEQFLHDLAAQTARQAAADSAAVQRNPSGDAAHAQGAS